MQETETDTGNKGTTEEFKIFRSSVGRLKHLSEKEIDKLCKEEPDITIRGYLAFLREINDIEKSTENEQTNE
jgi:hypothetical protein